MTGHVSVADAIRAGAARMAEHDPLCARIDAETLMAHALGLPRSQMLLHAMREPVPHTFDALVERRMAHEPVAYIVGEAEFWGRDFAVSRDVLIPRGDSEALIRAALDGAGEAGRVLDLGTGSGALLVTFLAERPGWRGAGTDRCDAALAVARRNAERHGVADRAAFERADWSIAGWERGLGTRSFDLVLCNPPYIELSAPLDVGVRAFEPAGALFAGDDGLADYRVLLPQLPHLLAPRGFALFEIGHTQFEAVAELAGANGFSASLERDLAGRPRCAVLRAGGDLHSRTGEGLAKGGTIATSSHTDRR